MRARTAQAAVRLDQQQEDHGSGAQMRQIAGFILPVGVYHREGWGQGFGTEVVVKHHDIAACRGDGFVRKCAAIDAEDQVMRGPQRLHGRDIRAIAFVNAVGDVKRRGQAEMAKPQNQKRGR